MKKKNLLVGIAAGAAILSVALLLRKNKYNWRSLYNSAEDTIDGLRSKINGRNASDDNSEFALNSPGRNLAQKARQKAEHNLAASRNGH